MLLARDFRAGQLPAGPQGPKGDPGPQGPKGDPGAPGASPGPAQVVTHDEDVLKDQVGGAHVDCPAGATAVSGGFDIAPQGADHFYVMRSRPAIAASGRATGWDVMGGNGSGITVKVRAYVLCVSG